MEYENVRQQEKRIKLHCIPIRPSPIPMRARLLMQEIWAAGVDWNDVLPTELVAKCNTWLVSHSACVSVIQSTSILTSFQMPLDLHTLELRTLELRTLELHIWHAIPRPPTDVAPRFLQMSRLNIQGYDDP